MPIYEYRCSACGFEKDALQKMADPPLVECPNCGKPALVKLVSAAGFHLKGSGWYATDFKSSGKPPPTKSDGDSKAESSVKPDSADSSKTTETKPAEKSATKSDSSAAASGSTSTGSGN